MKDFILWVLAFMVAAFVYTLIKNIYVRVKWGVFGSPPSILDESQVNLTVKECAEQYVQGLKESGVEFDADECEEAIEGYTRWVIESYVANFTLPRFGGGDGRGDAQKFGERPAFLVGNAASLKEPAQGEDR